MNMNPVPLLSVVSPYAGSETLPHFLTSLTRQSLDQELFELLLIEDGDHGGARIIESVGARFAVRVIPLVRPAGFNGHSAGLCRNLGARQARGRVLVFIDSDCILHHDCLRAHLALMSGRPGLAVCGAAKELPVYNHELLRREPPAAYEELSRSSLLDYRTETDDVTPPSGDGWDYWYSLNASVWREDFLNVSGFDESGYRCHDMDLAYRLFKSGLRFEYSQAPEVIHVEHPRSIHFRREQMKGWLNLTQRHPELRAFVEDRLIVLNRLLKTTIERCENGFRQITENLPGIRAGYTWLLPPGMTEEDVAPHLNYIPYVATDKQDLRYLNLRLHKNCWDYAVAWPKEAAAGPPVISVIIPTYNARDKVGRALMSVLLQTAQAFEIIVIDDASTDGTLREVIPFQTDPRVRVFSLRYNEGLSNALNAGLQQSQAPLVIQLDADDWLEETALESVLRIFQGDETVGAVYGVSVIHAPNGEVSLSAGSQLSTPTELLECTSPQAPRAFRKNALMAVGGWSTADAYFGRYFDDRLVLARVAEKYGVRYLPQRLYHIEERDDSLSRGKPLTFMAAKLAILWGEANRKGCLLSHTFNGRYLRAKFYPREATPVSSNWSVVIPFHRSAEQLRAAVRSWLQSDLMTTTAGEIIVVDDASGEPLDDVVSLDPSRIRVVRSEVRKGPAWARNAGAAVARHEMFFFSDADHVVPPDVLRSHERRHAAAPAPAVVVGGVHGRRTFLSVTPDCRVTHKQRLLELLRFDERFEEVARRLACGHAVALVDAGSCDKLWERASELSVSDPWYGDWAKIFLSHGEDLAGYAHRWTRVNSGSLSLSAETLKGLGGFDEYLTSMEDWELGARAQEANVLIVSAPEAEPYHQIHPADPERADKNRRAVPFIRAKHEGLVDELLSRKEKHPPPAAQVFRESLADAGGRGAGSDEQVVLPEHLAGGYCVLTFDDGPHTLGTSLILETLERFDFKATFFFLGAEVEKYQDLCRRTAALGHEIGIHGWTHTQVERLTTAENLDMLARAVDAVERVAGVEVRFVRPPYGRLNESFAVAAESLGLTLTGWDLSSDDWRALSKHDIIKNLASEGIKNKVILFHDAAGDPVITIEALEWLLAACAEFGVKVISLAECAAFRPMPTLKPMSVQRWMSDM